MEIWKNVKGYEGMYEVSDLGNVKSLERSVSSPRGLNRIIKERLLKPSKNKGGYLSVVLSKESICKTNPIHQLVVKTFLNKEIKGKDFVVNHINFNKTDNRLCNLEIVTFRNNTNRKHCKSSSKYTGVSWFKSRNKWISQIVIKGKNKYLGLFTNEIDAHLAYEKALKELLNQSDVKP